MLHPEPDSATAPITGSAPMPVAEALRVAARLADEGEDVHAVARAVLALVGADEQLTGEAAEAALANAGVPAEARPALVAALGPAEGQPAARMLRASLEAGLAAKSSPGARPRSWFRRLLAELHGRRVMRTALWYVGGSVAIVEAANNFLPALGAPEGSVRLLAIVAVCGLPIALALSWAFDVIPADRTAVARWPRLALLGGVVAVSLVSAVLIWQGGAGAGASVAAAGASSPADADPAHVAVLAFSTVGGDEELSALAAQLQLRLIDGLAGAAAGTGASRQLRVLSQAGVLPFTRGDVSVDSLREHRRVGTVLDGSVERADDAVRVRIRLVDTRTGFQLSTGYAEVREDDRIALLDAVADSVVRLVRTRLGPVVRDNMRLLETQNPEAFERVVWAARRLEQYGPAFERGDYETAAHVLLDADSMLAAAEALDPRWVEPILDRGKQTERRVRLAFARRDSSAVLPALEAGIAHAERALAIRPGDVRALALRGGLRHLRLQVAAPSDGAAADRMRSAAEHDLRSSLIGNPTPAQPLRLLSELAGGAGRLREALSYGARAYEEDPYMEQVHFTLLRLFQYSFEAREDSAAAWWCGEGRQRFRMPMFDDCRLMLGAWADGWPLEPDSAWALVAEELRPYPTALSANLEPRLHAMAAAVLVRHGMPDSARAVLHAARQRDASSPGMLRAAAGVHALLGETDEAMAVVQQLVRLRPAERRALGNAPELRLLHGEPQFRALIENSAARPR